MAKNSDVEAGKACAALSYLLVGIIWYFVDEKMKKNNFAKFHAKQGLALLIVWIVIDVVWTILTFASFGLFAFIWWIVWVVFLVLWLWGIINALNGKETPLPGINVLAEKFTF
jgi:uncharacterized membrane protein